jgi:hypothetical protein
VYPSLSTLASAKDGVNMLPGIQVKDKYLVQSFLISNAQTQLLVHSSRDSQDITGTPDEEGKT